MKTVAIALDLGTTSIKAGCLGSGGGLESVLARPVPEVSENRGRYESDASDYFEAADALLDRCLVTVNAPPALGLSCQRSSFLIWQKANGRPVSPLISWQDNRGINACRALQDKDPLIRKITGLRLTPYYFGPKLFSLLRERQDWRSGLVSGKLLLGTLDSYCIWRWSAGKAHQTDASMAARTLLMALDSRKWSKTLCELFRVPQQILPDISASCGLSVPLRDGLTLTSSVADQSAALYAGVSEDETEALVNLGTGGFVVRYLPARDALMNEGYLKTLVYENTGDDPRVAAEGTLNSIARAIAPYPYRQCTVDDLGAMEQIYCICEPSGLGAPYFRGDLGLVFSAPVDNLAPRQIASLLLESVIFRVARILEDFNRCRELRRVYLSGGLSALPCLYQGIALCCAFEVQRLHQPDSSLLGAALLAAGFPPAFGRTSEIVQTTDDPTHLREKYARWKNWLDDLLAADFPERDT